MPTFGGLEAKWASVLLYLVTRILRMRMQSPSHYSFGLHPDPIAGGPVGESLLKRRGEITNSIVHEQNDGFEMEQLIIGSLTLSILHAAIPSHWLPVVAIGRKESWAIGKVLRVTALAGMAHVFSTMLIGVMLGLLGWKLSLWVEHFTHIVAPSILIALGFLFVYRHHAHKHFHLEDHPSGTVSDNQIIMPLIVAMFLSPCLEIEAYFLMAGALGVSAVVLIGVLYTLISISGMVLWVRVMYKGVQKFNWHSLDHSAGIITGATLVLTGLISFCIH